MKRTMIILTALLAVISCSKNEPTVYVQDEPMSQKAYSFIVWNDIEAEHLKPFIAFIPGYTMELLMVMLV